MILNYILLGVTGLWGGIGIFQMVKGGSRVRPFQTIAMVIVFVIALVATLMGITYDQLIMMIEGR